MKKAFKLTSLVFVLAVILSFFTVTVGASTYPSEDYWATEALNAAVKNQILYGKENGNLDPEVNLTRAEMAAIIVRAFGANIKTDISRFYDVSSSQWYYDDIAKAVHMGVFVGDAGNTMRPDDPIIREEAFTVLARALVLSSSDYSSLNRFTDSWNISEWAKEYLSVLAKKGYVNGNQNSEITPKDNITRAEFAQFMHNIFKTYFVTAGTYSSTGADSSLIRHENINLSNLTVPGDLVIGDGANLSTVTLTNVKIQGRLLVRGAAQVKLVNVTVGENVVVKNINSNVHFDNYRTETVFNNINIITSATFKTDATGGGGGGGGGGGSITPPPIPLTATVTLNADGGIVTPTTLTVALNGAIGTLPTPTKQGHIFDGWYVGNTKIDSTYIVSGNITIVAHWIPTTGTYTVTFKGFNTDGTDKTETVMAGGKVTNPGTLTKTGYTFGGYFTDANYNIAFDFDNTVINANTTIYVKWTANTYKVTFNANGGSVTPDKIDVTYNSTYQVLPIPTHSDPLMKFVGWYTDKDVWAHEIKAGNKVEITSDTEVFARWTNKDTYTVTFKGFNADGTDKTETIIDGETVANPGTLTKTGYTFGGYYADSTYTTPFDFNTAITTDTTIYVKWTINIYTVTFDSDGGSAVAPQTVEYGGKATKPADPTKQGHVFKGWTLYGSAYNFSNPVTKDITLKAKWEEYKVSYVFEFRDDTGFIKTAKNFNLSDRVVLPEQGNYLKEGYIFLGWSTDPSSTTSQYAPKYQFTPSVDTANGTVFTFYGVWVDEVSATPVKVTFYYYDTNEAGAPIEIYAGQTIDNVTLDNKKYTDIPSFDEDRVFAGYVKDQSVSSVYTQDYQDMVEYEWWYNDNGKWKLFDENVIVNTDMDVFLKIKRLSLNINASSLSSAPFTFNVYYNNETRILDSFKNLMYTQDMVYDLPRQSNGHLYVINLARSLLTQDDTIIAKLIEKKIIDESHNILNQELFVRFSDVLKILGKDLEEYILDTAESMFENNNNDALKDSVLEYFKTKLESGSEDDKKEVKSMMKDAINKALSDDSTKDDALSAVEEMLETILADDKAFTEMAESFGYDVSDISSKTTKEFISELIVDELDKEYEEYLNDSTKPTELLDLALKNIPYNKLPDNTYVYSKVSDLVGKTTKEFIIGLVNKNLTYDFVTNGNGPVTYTNAELFAMAREKAVAMVLDLIVTDINFLNDVITKEFAGTPLEGYTADKIASFNSTVDLIVDMVEHELESLTDEYGNTDYDEFAKRLGYDSKDEMLDDKKVQIKDAIINELQKEDFFNELIQHTEFKDYTYSYLKSISPIDLFKQRVENEINAMTDDELAKKLGEVIGDSTMTTRNQMIEYIKGKIKDEIIAELNDLTKTLFEEMYYELVGESYNSALTTRQVVAKIAAKSENDPGVETLVNNDNSAYEEAVNELTNNTITVSNAETMTSREFVIEVVRINLEKNDEFKEAYEKYKDTTYSTSDELDNALIADARTYAIDEAKKALNNEENLKKEIKELTGFEFDNISSYATTFVLIVDYVEKEFTNRTFEEIVNDFHYVNVDEILDDARPYIIEDVLDETRTNADFRREELEMYINAGVTDDSKKITFGDLPDSEDADGDNLPDEPLKFVGLYSEKSIALLDNATLMTELTSLGYDVETLFNKYGKDIVIRMLENAYTGSATTEENELFDTVFAKVSSKYDFYKDLPDNLKADSIKFIIDELKVRLSTDEELFKQVLNIAKEELGYDNIDPDNLPNNPKDFIIDVVMNEFEKGGDKQDELINYAVDYLEKHTDMLDGLIDFAMDYLNSNEGQRDELINEVINTVYRDTLDELIRQLKEEKQFEVTSESLFVATGLKSVLEDYKYENLIKKVPQNIREKIFAIYPEQKVIDIYGGAFDSIIDQIDTAVNNKGGTIDSGFTFNINPIDDIYAPLYDSFVDILENDPRTEKIKDKIKYDENEYLPELVKLLSVETLFNNLTADKTHSGYQLKDFDEYYNLILNAVILADDAIARYKELYPEEEIQNILTGYEDLALKYANILAEFLDGYANGTKDPDNKYFDKVEGIIKSKFPEQFDKLLNWYKDSPINKKYESDDYAKFRKAVRKAYEKYDMVTDAMFDDEYIDKALSKLDKILVAENTTYTDFNGITHNNADIYEITVKGKTGRFVVVNEDIYEISIEGNIITIAREWQN